MFELLKEDYARRWNRPLSWWNLAALAPVLFFLLLSVHSSWKVAQAAARQQTAIGIIDGHDPPNHDRYSYTFTVHGNQWTGWASPNDKRNFFLGQRIVIYFDPIDPSENSAYDFHEANPGGIVFIWLLLTACVGFPFYIYFQRRSRKGVDPKQSGD